MFDITAIPGLEKIVLGIVLAAPIGPVSIEMIRRGLNHGAFSAFTVRLGAAAGNTLCLLGAFFGLSHIVRFPWIFNTLGLAGAGFLLYTGVRAIFKPASSLALASISGNSNGLWCGFYLSIANPIAVVFWSGIYAASAADAGDTSLGNFLLNMLIIIGVLLWGAVLAIVLGFARSYLTEKSMTWVNRLSGVLMVYFGCKYLVVIICTLMPFFR